MQAILSMNQESRFPTALELTRLQMYCNVETAFDVRQAQLRRMSRRAEWDCHVEPAFEVRQAESKRMSRRAESRRNTEQKHSLNKLKLNRIHENLHHHCFF